jgi:hypothetical protein
MDDCVEAMFSQKLLDKVLVTNVAVDEMKIGYAVQIGAVAGVCERIENDEFVVRILVAPIAHKICANEPSAASY